MKSFKIKTPKGERIIGEGYPTFIVAEMSANHNQDFDTAVKIVESAARAGADAIKLQTYSPDTITMDCDKEWFIISNEENPDSWKKKTLYQIYQKAFTPRGWHPKLKKIAEDLGLVFFSSPFAEDDIDFLENLNIPLYKVASYEVTHIPLLRRIAQTQKPVIMSVGFATLEEIELAVNTLRKNGTKNLILLHCVTAYTKEPKPEYTNLKTMVDLSKRFKTIVGFSDNNAGIEIPLQAVMMGASVIEKHLVADYSKSESLDQDFSVDSDELKKFIEAVRKAEKIRGEVNYGPQSEIERKNSYYRRSIFAVRNIKKDEQFTTLNIKVIRPQAGLAPKHFEEILGKTASQDIEKGTPLKWSSIKEKIIDNKIIFRPATKKDCNFLFELRNDPLVRANSTHSEEIELKNHRRWLSKSLVTTERKLFIVMLEEKKIGQVRFDKDEGSNSAEINISLIKEYRGQGLGSTIIEKSCQFAFSNFGYHTIQAKIKKDNESSIKSFQKGGFKEEKQDENYLFMELTIKDDS